MWKHCVQHGPLRDRDELEGALCLFLLRQHLLFAGRCDGSYLDDSCDYGDVSTQCDSDSDFELDIFNE